MKKVVKIGLLLALIGIAGIVVMNYPRLNIITGFAFDNVSGNSQAHILRCTFGGGVHHTIRVKYWQGGGDGGPRADRATMRFIS